MWDRIKEILSPEILSLIKQAEMRVPRRLLVYQLVSETDKPPKELLEEYLSGVSDTTKEDALPRRVGAYETVLAETLLTEMELKEKIEKMQNLLEKEHEESEE